MLKKLLKFSPIVILVAILATGWFHRYWLFDTYRLALYEPSQTIEELADRAGMSDYGERLFFAAQPQLLLEEEFDQNCEFAELGLVLGCYRSADIFILDVTEDQLEPVEPVTAGHEMLHVVFARMNPNEEDEIKILLDKQLEKVTNNRILEEIDGYRDDPDADLYNEMHSIFGTELTSLIPELEEHYSEYFSDRSLILQESAAYEKVFRALEKEIDNLDAQLSTLAAQIENREVELDSLSAQIDTQRSQLDSYDRNNQISQYNALVPGFNNLVNSHNAKVTKLKELIDRYNVIVEVRNENVAAKNNLIKSLDSSVQAIE